MRFKVVAVLLVLCTSAYADLEHDPVTDFRLRDPAAGTVQDSVSPEPFDCPGEHDVKVTFSPVLAPPRFTPVPWLTAPATATFEAGGYPVIDVDLNLGDVSPGIHQGVVRFECTRCSEGDCVGQTRQQFVQLEVAAPATFGASSADQDFGGLVDGKPVSAHDLVVNIVNEVKASEFMELEGAQAVVSTLESKYLDRAFTSNDLSDVSFVRMNSTSSDSGRISTEVVPVDDETVLPGNARYIGWGFLGMEEEIFIGVDMSLAGLNEARKNPEDYYIFTLDGDLGVIKRADLVHNIFHEGFHATLAGKYNTETKTGDRGACLEEEQEGFRVGNAAARALGLPEDNEDPGESYGGCRNPDYVIQFPGLAPPGAVAPAASTEPVPSPHPVPVPTPSGGDTRTSSLDPVQNPADGSCASVDYGFICDGPPNVALVCDESALGDTACSLVDNQITAPCSFGSTGWTCDREPQTVAVCTDLGCSLSSVAETGACQAGDAGYTCNAMPVYSVRITPGSAAALDDFNLPADAMCADEECIDDSAACVDEECTDDGAECVDDECEEAPADSYDELDRAAEFLFGATQPVDCERAGTGAIWPIPSTGPDLADSIVDDIEPRDLFADIIGAFNTEADPGLEFLGMPHEFMIIPPAQGSLPGTWPGEGPAAMGNDSSTDPLKGAFRVTPRSTGIVESGSRSYQLQGGYFDSINVPDWVNGEVPAIDPYVQRRMRIGGAPYTTLLFPEYRRRVVIDILVRAGFTSYEDNSCRVVLVPTDPNYTRTGRHGGNSWGAKLDDQWAIKRVGFTDDETSAWGLVTDPEPVVVAVIDTGLDWHHRDVDPATIWRNADEIPDNGVDDDRNGYVDDVIGWDFVAQNNRPWDFDGHGTIVTGIIAAAHNGIGVAGINPAAQIMVLKGVNNFGTTRASWLAEAIVYAVDNGAQIINISVGGPHESGLEKAALDYARARGVLVIAASGNSGVELADFGPGGHDSVLTVGATHDDDQVTGFSNFGDKVDIVAPGVDVLSLRARYTDANYRPGQQAEGEYTVGTNYVGEDKRYIRANGTSFSTPIVAGIASLVMANNAELSGAEVEQILLQTASDVDLPGKDKYTGHGMVDARAALSVADGFFVTADIADVRFEPAEGPTVARVYGTIDAAQFKRAWVQIGPGENPGGWRYVGQKRKYPITDGLIATIPLSQFSGSDLWQVVVNVEDASGVLKRAVYSVTPP